MHVVGDEALGLECFPTPGHAWHHVSYLDRDGTLYAGDAAGVRLTGGRFVMPPCPPPDIDLEAWEDTIAEIERRAPARLALIHFGVVDDVIDQLGALRETLERWGKRVEDGMDEEAFVAAARYDVSQTDPDLVDEYERAGPYWHHFRGIERYWRQRREGPVAHMSRAACASRSSSDTNSSAEACVASRTTGGATPASNASCQRAATTHQRSPG